MNIKTELTPEGKLMSNEKYVAINATTAFIISEHLQSNFFSTTIKMLLLSSEYTTTIAGCDGSFFNCSSKFSESYKARHNKLECFQEYICKPATHAKSNSSILEPTTISAASSSIYPSNLSNSVKIIHVSCNEIIHKKIIVPSIEPQASNLTNTSWTPDLLFSSLPYS